MGASVSVFWLIDSTATSTIEYELMLLLKAVSGDDEARELWRELKRTKKEISNA